jgi:hypothetical protein
MNLATESTELPTFTTIPANTVKLYKKHDDSLTFACACVPVFTSFGGYHFIYLLN